MKLAFKVPLLTIPLLLLSCWGARTGLNTQERVPRCSETVHDLPVYLSFDRANPITSQVARVTWWFKVACNPVPPPYVTHYYTFGARQLGDGSVERLSGDGRTRPPDLSLIPGAEAFSFNIRGPIFGDWCATVEVEFADGTVRSAGPMRSLTSETPVRVVPIAVQVFRQGEENRVALLYSDAASICTGR